MRTAADVGAMRRQVEAGSRERGVTLGTAALLGAFAAALLLLLGSAWFSVGAGADYPEPAPIWTR